MTPRSASKRLMASTCDRFQSWRRHLDRPRLAVLVILALSSAWSLFASILNVWPKETANYLMKTSQYDDGEFWQLAAGDFPLIVAMVYLYLCILVIRPPSSSSCRKMCSWRDTVVKGVMSLVPQAWMPVVTQVGAFYRELTAQHGKYRKLWNLVMEVLEITFETLTLFSMLNQGLDPWFIKAYVALMVVNCVYCFYHITIAWKKHAFYEMVGDAVLDVVFAIGVPALTLARAMLDFKTNLWSMAIRQHFLPAQVYDHRGLLYADPAEVNAFATSFGSLRISNGVDLVVTVGAAGSHRHTLLSLQNHRSNQASSIVPLPPAKPTAASLIATERTNAIVDKERGASRNANPVTNPNTALTAAVMTVTPHRVIHAFVGPLFLAYGAVITLDTLMAISSSRNACRPLDMCARFSHVWFPFAPSSVCPCLAYIEGSVEEHADSYFRDATMRLSQAAEAGSLRTIHMVNRGLYGSLPLSVMGCRELRQLIIVNCGFSKLPTGRTSTFTKLVYLHISGKANQLNLVDLPVDFFSNMGSLRTLYLDHHASLTTLPPFHGLHRLEMLYLGDTRIIIRLPSFNDTPSRRTLALIGNKVIMSLPDLTPLAKSLQAVHIKSTPLCCSGFLSHGECNLAYPTCFSFSAYDDQHSCYPSVLDTELDNGLRISSDQFPLISEASLAVLKPSLDGGLACNTLLEPPHEIEDICEGVNFRQCPKGICYSYDIGTVFCVNDSRVIDMRKRSLQLGRIVTQARRFGEGVRGEPTT